MRCAGCLARARDRGARMLWRPGRPLTAVLALLVLLCAFPAVAVEPSEVLPDPALEARAREIGRELRCVVCQNQSIDDSAAEIARDMRRAVRERLVAGDSNRAVFDFMVSRYGDYVLLKPPFKSGTIVLWLGAPFVLVVAGGILLYVARRRRTIAAPVPLSEDERKRLAIILDETQPSSPPGSGV